MMDSSIYDYLTEAEKNLGGTGLRLLDSKEISLVLNSVAEMYGKYDARVKASIGTIRDVEIRDNLGRLWKRLESVSGEYEARLTGEMKRLRDLGAKRKRKTKQIG